MIGLQSVEEKIGGRIGWSREKVQKTVTLCSRIPPQILVLAKTFQKGRGGCFPPNGGINDHSANAPKNERSVTLRSKIGAEILFLAKNFQAGRAPSNGANAPKNERSVTSGLSGVIWKPFPDTLLPNAATVNLFRPVTKMVISISETSTFARQAAYTPPWEEIVNPYTYIYPRSK